jgi:serine/threonine protein kinase
MPKLIWKRGDTFGHWQLTSYLGSGGNAEVWRARHTRGGDTRAIKLLKNVSPDSDAYKRFRSEITLHQAIGNRKGILPVLDYDLPARPIRSSPAWFVMPVATPIRKALQDSFDIETAVKAVLSIAETLASLVQEDVFHRDIKPDNLYYYEGNWTIGDFGLATYPNKEAMTAPGRRLGPMFFIADEMISDPQNAAAAPADVFSLAKVLWVLVTGQMYPPQGGHRADEPEKSVRHYVSHPRARHLDHLIERATSYDPTRRPTMAEMASHLRAWSQRAEPRENAEDYTDLSLRVRPVLESGQRQVEQRQAIHRQVEALQQRLCEHLQSIPGKLLQVTGIGRSFSYPHAEILTAVPRLITNRWEGQGVVHSSGVLLEEETPTDPSVYLKTGVGIEVLDDGLVYLAAAHIVGYKQSSRGRPPVSEIIWQAASLVPFGSALEEHAIVALTNGLKDNLGRALVTFVEWLEWVDSQSP